MAPPDVVRRAPCVIDLHDVTFVDRVGLGVLLELDGKHDCTLVNPSGPDDRLLNLIGVAFLIGEQADRDLPSSAEASVGHEARPRSTLNPASTAPTENGAALPPDDSPRTPGRLTLLRRHPHLQGLILGFALLAAAAGATPYALSCIAGLTTPATPPTTVPVADDSDAEAVSVAREDTATPVDSNDPAGEEPLVGLDGQPLASRTP